MKGNRKSFSNRRAIAENRSADARIRATKTILTMRGDAGI